jgi:hypothetical protein
VVRIVFWAVRTFYLTWQVRVWVCVPALNISRADELERGIHVLTSNRNAYVN